METEIELLALRILMGVDAVGISRASMAGNTAKLRL
jgi:hypothetical protein